VPPLHWALPWALVFYASVVVLETLRAGGRIGILGRLRLLAIFPAMHVAHGTGFGVGLVGYALRPNWSARPDLAAPSAGQD
jgi:hypothetical protein